MKTVPKNKIVKKPVNYLFSLTEECAKITGIRYVMDAFREEALEIIDS